MKARADVIKVVEYLDRFDVPFGTRRDRAIREISGLGGRRSPLFAGLALFTYGSEGAVKILAGTGSGGLGRSDMSLGPRCLSITLACNAWEKDNTAQNG